MDERRSHSALFQGLIKITGQKMGDKKYFYKATIEKVYDGDTFTKVTIDLGWNVLIKTKIRLAGINCPEIRTKDKNEKELGLKAKEFTKNFVEDKEVLVHTIKTGKFGRILCEVFVNGKSLNKALVKVGLAREYFGGKRTSWFNEKGE